MKRKKWTALLLALALCTATLTGCSGSSDSSDETSQETEETVTEEATEESEDADDTEETADAETETEEETELLSGQHYVTIEIQDYGTIYLVLDADTAPITVTNFINLANEGFYDGLTFHRIISGFMIQGGDPLGNGTGGSENTIKGEFSENGVENNISHVRGVISMARATDPDSASSQFFIMHEDATYLDGQYAAFGYVTDGMDVVDAICENTPVQDNNGTVNAEDQPVITAITVVE